jgi:hypothetical protein
LSLQRVVRPQLVHFFGHVLDLLVKGSTSLNRFDLHSSEFCMSVSLCRVDPEIPEYQCAGGGKQARDHESPELHFRSVRMEARQRLFMLLRLSEYAHAQLIFS